MKNLVRVVLLFHVLIIAAFSLQAQNSVGIGTVTPNPNAVLELVSPNSNQGLLVPRLTTVERTDALFLSQLGTGDQALLVFDTDENSFFFWSGTEWMQVGNNLTSGSGIAIAVDGTLSNTGDLDNENEIQDLTLTGDALTITNNATASSIDLSGYLDNTDAQDLDFTSGVLTLSGDPDASLIDLSNYDSDVSDDFDGDFSSLLNVPAGLADGDDNTQLTDAEITAFGYIKTDNVDDADADPANEIQDLQLVSNVLTITGNGSATPINLAPYSGSNTDDQILSILGTDLTISGGNTIDIGAIDTDTDDQTLSITGANLTISEGNTVSLGGLQDGFEANTDEQELSVSADILSITGGVNTIDLSGYLDNTDNQTLALTGSNLSITGGNSISLATLQDGFEANTDNQTLALSGSALSISGGNSIDLSTVDSDNQMLSLTGTDLSIADGNTISLASLQDGFEANTDNQSLSLSGTSLSISSGNTVNLVALQDGTGTDDQQLTFDGSFNTLSIEGGNSVDLSSLAIDNVIDADADPTNEHNTSFSISASNLELVDGGGTLSVPLASLQDGFEANTDNQSLTLAGNSLAISGGNSVNLSTIDTDDQTLSFAGSSLTISEGNSVDLSALQDGYEANTDAQDLSLAGNTLSLTNDDTPVDLSAYLDNTDDQTLKLTGTLLDLSGGNSVDLSPIIGDPNATNELLTTGSMSGNTLRLFEGSNNVNVDLSQFALPAQSMSAGQFLTTNGTSVNWADVPSGPWNTGGSNINYTAGNVGIGVSAPLANYQLEVETTLPGGIYVDNNATTGTNYGIIVSMNTGASGTKNGIYISGEDHNYFSGNVGIGTTAPSAKLDVVGNVEINGILVTPASGIYSTNSSAGIVLAKPTRRVMRVRNSAASTISAINGILAGDDGQEVIIIVDEATFQSGTDPLNNTNQFTVRFLGESTWDQVIDSRTDKLLLSSTYHDLKGGSVLHLIYDGSQNAWLEISHSLNYETSNLF